MKINSTVAVILSSVFLWACNGTQQKESTTSVDSSSTSKSSTTTTASGDNRPKDELYFLNKVKNESAYQGNSGNAVEKDAHIAAFDKYAKDSLKRITNWEMTVTEVNDNPVEANSVAKALFDPDNNPVYNLQLVAPIKIDKTVDTIAIDNRVDFTVTIPKTPKGDSLKAQLAVLKMLKAGDAVVISGSLTHLDNSGKISFSPFYDDYQPWNVDLLLTAIKKKQ